MTAGADRGEGAASRAFEDPNLPDEERIDDLVARLTLAEKVECLGTNPSVPRLGVKGSGHVEGLHGLALGGPGRWGGKRPVPTTTFPQAIGLAQTWDPDLVRAVAAVEAHEARHAFQSPAVARGGLVVRAPNADLGRDPRWGRTEECYGEDPFLAGTLAVAFVRGLQGDHPRYWKTAALLKHFFANSNENGRERTSSDFDESLFRDYYSVPFRMAIEEGGSRAFMAAYNAHNGVPCTVHPVLQGAAAGEWGQNGIFCTDAGALKFLVTAHRSHPDLQSAAAACVRAGITQFLDDYADAVAGALERGLLVEADIDGAIRGNFRVMLRLGLLDPPESVPYSRIGLEGPPPWSTEEHRAVARRATQESIVLLKNDGALPLDASTLKSVAVIGPLADRVLIDWYSGTPPYAVSPLEGIRARLGQNVALRQATANDDSDAVRIARECDVCVVCVGNHPTGDGIGWAEVTRASYGREAVDRRSIELEDEKLVRDVFEANPRTIVVLVASFPYAIEWTKAHAPAIVLVTHNSQELGTALADVLFGDVSPAGRLVQTWPRSLADLPPLLDYDIRRGRTHLYATAEPLWPFGFGLSYTSFEYRTIAISADSIDSGGAVTVSVEIANTGPRAGDEVVQLYVRRTDRRADEPLQSLRGFQRVRLEPGEARTVEFSLEASDLATWSATDRAFEVRRGEIEIVVGGSSAHAALRRRMRVE